MTTTKHERHKIYKLMLEKYVEDDSYLVGFCTLLNNIYFKYYNPYKMFGLSDLPELYVQKPVNATLYWFPIKDRESRITILKKCIELTKPEKDEKTSLLQPARRS
jgi:hypothetical protein